MSNELINHIDMLHTTELGAERIKRNLGLTVDDVVHWYEQKELQEALRSIQSTIGKCEKVLPKLREGTSQHTLTIRRVKALQIAVTLITRELEDVYGKENP